MSITQLAGPFGEWRAATTAPGTAITAAVTAATALVALPPGTHYVSMEGRNYSTAVVIRWTQNPWLTVVKTTDNFAVAGNATDYSDAAQDGAAATDVVLSSLATTGALWVGADLPFRGVFADVDSSNSNAATCVAVYWNGTTLASLSITDTTSSGSAVFAQDGSITWTMPSDWSMAAIRPTIVATAAATIPAIAAVKYWARLTFSGALDASTTLDQLLALNRSTTYAALVTGRVAEFLVPTGTGRIGCIEAITDAGTANLIVNCATMAGSKFP